MGCPRHVRFPPVSDRTADIAALPKSAKPDIGALQSITSSALIRIRNSEGERIRWLAIDDEFSAGHSEPLSPMVSSIREHRRNAAGLASDSRVNSRQF
jgi:hypothetical protein